MLRGTRAKSARISLDTKTTKIVLKNVSPFFRRRNPSLWQWNNLSFSSFLWLPPSTILSTAIAVFFYTNIIWKSKRLNWSGYLIRCKMPLLLSKRSSLKTRMRESPVSVSATPRPKKFSNPTTLRSLDCQRLKTCSICEFFSPTKDTKLLLLYSTHSHEMDLLKMNNWEHYVSKT